MQNNENEQINEQINEQKDEREYISFSKTDENGKLIETIGYFENSDISDFLDEYFGKEEEIEHIRKK